MILTLYNKANVKKLELSPAESSSQQKEVQSDNILSLLFTSYECVGFDVLDYIDFCGERFWVAKQYIPKQVSTVEWEYSVQLYGIESFIKQFLVIQNINGDYETEFSYTATARDHVALIVDCINAGMESSEWKVGEVVDSEYLVVDYEGTYCNDGLGTVAGKCGVEYWIQGTTVNVSYCEHSELITLGYNNGLTSIYPATADNVGFFTRLFPIGSTRNIVYKDYGHTRLQLPSGVKYVDQDVEKYGVVHHYEKSAFAHIYPRRVGAISHVRSQEVIGENGEPFTIYYFKDESLNFDPNEYEIEKLVKSITFQSGDLYGRDFEVNFDSETCEFEIITQWPYQDDTQLPNEYLTPVVGDEYVIWNISMPTEYYPLAETEYKIAVDEYMAEQRKDVSIYRVHTDYVDIAARGINLTIGQRVRLEHTEYFTQGYRNSRITKITRNVFRPTEMDIEIGDVLSKGALEQFNNSVAEVKNYTKAATSNIPAVIKSWESTQATDTNLYSARKSVQEFLSKRYPDVAHGLIDFLSGIKIGDTIDSMLAGKGVVIDDNGRIQASRLEVRDSMMVQELIYNRQSAMEGDYVFSEGGTIETIEQTSSTSYYATMKKEWDLDFTALEEGDIVRGVVNNLQSGSKQYYTSWCRVLSKDASANALSLVVYDDDDVPGSRNYPPTGLMKLNRWGNIANEDRQSVWFISSYDGMIVRLTGVTKPILEQYNYGTTWGKTPNFLKDMNLPINPNHDYMFARGAIIQDLMQIDYQGKPIATTVDRGVWSAATAEGDEPYLFEAYNSNTMRYESHEVWHHSIKWQCLDSKTTSPPAWNSADWSALTGSFEIQIAPTNGIRFFKGSNVNTILTATLYNGDADISADIEDSQVEWTRLSSQPDEDLAWNIMRANAGLSLAITPNDLPSDFLETKRVSFKCTVSLLETMKITREFKIS